MESTSSERVVAQTPPGGEANIIGKKGRSFQRQQKLPDPIKFEPPEGLWEPDHCLFIGIGGIGRKVLNQIKKNLFDAGAGDIPAGIRFLAVDTDEYDKIRKEDEQSSFAGIEMSKDDLFVLDENLGEVLLGWKNQGSCPAEFEGWLKPGQYSQDESNLKFGTHGNRCIPRVALIRNIQEITQNSEWKKLIEKERFTTEGDNQVKNISWKIMDHLKERCSCVKRDDNTIRIMVTASLAGGMSGLLADVAILARLAAKAVLDPGGGTVIVEAFLLDGAMAEGDEADKHKANSYAALREIMRWQLNFGFPLSPAWKSEGQSGDVAFIRDPLFSDLFLFSKPQHSPAGVDILSQYIIPGMADCMTLFLDKAAGAQRIGQYLKTGKNTREERQKREHVLCAARVGVYSIHFPVIDILKALHARWGYELLQTRLSGSVNREVKFDKTLVIDSGLPAEPASAIQAFLDGSLSSFGGVDIEDPSVEERKLAELVFKENTDMDFMEMPIGEMGAEIKPSRNQDRIEALLKYILVGTTDEDKMNPSPRAAHLQYCIEMMDLFRQELTRIEEGLRQKEVQPEFIKFVEIYKNEIESQFNGLQKFKNKLSFPGDEKEPKGLLQQLNDRAKSLETYVEQMEKVVNRHYIWKSIGQDNDQHPRKFYDCWWKKYLSEDFYENLPYLSWDFYNHSLDLRILVRSSDHELVQLNRDGVDAVSKVLEQWGQFKTRKIWEDKPSLGHVLPIDEVLGNKEQGISIGRIAKPLNITYQADAAAAQPYLLLMLPDIVQEKLGPDHNFRQGLKEAMEGTKEVKIVENVGTTDPLSAYFFYIEDAIRVDQLPGTEICKAKYDLLDGYRDERFQGRPIPRAVFRADGEIRGIETDSYPNVTYRNERNGKIVSTSYPLYHPYREFGTAHPIICSALQRPHLAELYCLTIADGRILPDDREIKFVLDNQQFSFPLINTDIDPLVEGLLRWSCQDRLPDAWREFLSELRSHFSNAKIMKSDQITGWISKMPREWQQSKNHEKKSLGYLVIYFARYYINNGKRRYSDE